MIPIGKFFTNCLFKSTLVSSFFLNKYRSPWSNTYDPPLEDDSYAPAMPTEKLRKLEVDANTAFEQYREMYFEGGVSSVYLWDLEHGFAGNDLLGYI